MEPLNPSRRGNVLDQSHFLAGGAESSLGWTIFQPRTDRQTTRLAVRLPLDVDAVPTFAASRRFGLCVCICGRASNITVSNLRCSFSLIQNTPTRIRGTLLEPGPKRALHVFALGSRSPYQDLSKPVIGAHWCFPDINRKKEGRHKVPPRRGIPQLLWCNHT